MTETRYKFRTIPPRDDTADIKYKCYCDSVPQKETGDSWNTLYNDTYIKHPLNARPPAAHRPKQGIHIGGGNLEPTEQEETRSNYQNYFKKFDESAVPPKAEPLPNSDIFPHDVQPIESTAQSAMKEANDNRPPYDNREAKERVTDARNAHFFFGDNSGQYQTNYSTNFIKRPISRPPPVDNKLYRSSVEFDPVAGIGPHTKDREKKGEFPQIGDAPKPNHLRINFDVGYSKLDYQTTTKSQLQARRQSKPESFKAPPCAEISDHGAAAGPWQTTYSTDFEPDRKPVPNQVDINDLRGTHFDIGHDKTNWTREEMAVAKTKPKHETIDLQISNPVFRGDGDMRWQTTSNDLIGNFDKSKDGRGVDHLDARADHLFLGGEKVDYGTSAQAANRCAGQGKPAQKVQDLHLLKGVGFARGGAWDQFATDPLGDADEKDPIGQPETFKVDSKYFTQTHFALDATKNSKCRYKTTYFEEICKPKIAE